MLMHIFPDIMVTPAGKAFVNTVPIAIFLRQEAPLRSAAGYPEHAFDEKTAIGFFSSVCSGMILQEGVDFLPLFVLKGYV